MGPLAFGNPLLLWGLAALAVPVAVHLLSRRRSRRMAFAAIDFILKARKRNVRHIRLKQLLLLLARCLLVLAVAAAIARPLIAPKEVAAATAGAAAATAVVLDASMSMRWDDGGGSLFEHARDEAKSLLQRLPEDSPATLVVCDGTSVEAEPPSFDRSQLIRRLNDATPTHLGADVTACMAAAARALGESPLEAKRLYVVSDLTTPSLRLDTAPPRVPRPDGTEVLPEIVFVDAAQGEALPNLAVTDVAVSPSRELGARGFEVAATIRNSGESAARSVPVALEIDGKVVTRGFVDVPARSTARKVLAHRLEPGTRRGRVVLAPDALKEDDARAFVLRVPNDVRALVVDGAPSAVRHRDEAFFIDAALGPGHTGGRITATFLDADAGQSRSLEEFDVVLLLNLAAPRTSFVESLRTFVEGGGGLFVSLGDQVDPDDYDAVFGDLLPRRLHLVRTAAEPGVEDGAPPARFARIDLQHPAFAIFEGASEGFDTARIWRYVLPEPEASPGERVLATLDDGAPIIIEAPKGRGKVVLYTSTVDRDWTDWPIRTTFLPALQQLTAYLANGLDETPPRPVRVGEEAAPELPAGTTLEALLGPDDKPLRNAKLEAPGHYTPRVVDPDRTVRDAGELAFAAVTDARESDTTRLDPDELASHFGGEQRANVASNASGALPGSGTPLWTWLLVAAVVFFFAEGLLVRKA